MLFSSYDYPEEKGKIKLRFIVSKEGQAYYIDAVGENTYINSLVCAYIDHSESWKPAIKNGKPVGVQLEVEMEYK